MGGEAETLGESWEGSHHLADVGASEHKGKGSLKQQVLAKAAELRSLQLKKAKLDGQNTMAKAVIKPVPPSARKSKANMKKAKKRGKSAKKRAKKSAKKRAKKSAKKRLSAKKGKSTKKRKSTKKKKKKNKKKKVKV